MDQQNEASTTYAWWVLCMGTLVVFASLGLARFGYTVLLPAMQTGLSMDNTQAGLLATANLVGYLGLSAIGGALASRFGPRAVISVGLLVAVVSMVATGLAQTATTAGVWRAVTGMGSGASNVPVMGLMAAWFGARRRGMAAGIAVTGSSFALIFLGPAVPRLLNAFGPDGWRVCWFIYAGATLAIALGAYAVLRNHPSEVGQKAVGLAPGEHLPAQARAKSGLSWGSVYKSPKVWHLGAVYTAFGFSYIIYIIFFVKALMAEGGYSKEAAGNLFMIMGWVSLSCGLLWGMVSDALGRRAALVMVFCLQTVSYSLFALWPTPAGFTISAILFGLCAWSIPAIMAAACGDALGSRMAPAALGFITLFFGMGQAAGPGVAGAMADSSGSFAPAFLLAAGVALAGAAGAWFLKLDKQ